MFSNAVKSAIYCGKDLKESIREFLAIYRSTMHASTGYPPCVLLHGRGIRTGLHIPYVHKLLKNWSSDEVCENVLRQQENAKQSTDQKRGAKWCDLKPGDFVKVRKSGHVPKGTMKFSDPIEIAEICGPATFKTIDGRICNQSKLIPISPTVPIPDSKERCDFELDPMECPNLTTSDVQNAVDHSNVVMTNESTTNVNNESAPEAGSYKTALRRSVRSRRPPVWQKDFCM